MEPLLQQYVFDELKSDNNFMKARACWLYGQFGAFPFQSEDHLRHSLNLIYENLHHPDLPVRVFAALALNHLLVHDIAIDFLRPGLESLLKNYLKIMDDIDFDNLVKSLQDLVEVYEEEIAPYAIGLC
jgi:importin-7